jgi:hypothetical protein
VNETPQCVGGDQSEHPEDEKHHRDRIKHGRDPFEEV